MAESAKTRKTRIGVVVSNKMDKSIVVETVRLMKHKSGAMFATWPMIRKTPATLAIEF